MSVIQFPGPTCDLIEGLPAHMRPYARARQALLRAQQAVLTTHPHDPDVRVEIEATAAVLLQVLELMTMDFGDGAA